MKTEHVKCSGWSKTEATSWNMNKIHDMVLAYSEVRICEIVKIVDSST